MTVSVNQQHAAAPGSPERNMQLESGRGEGVSRCGITSEQSGSRSVESRGPGQEVGVEGVKEAASGVAIRHARACTYVRRVISDLRAGMPGRQWTTTFKERSRKVTHEL